MTSNVSVSGVKLWSLADRNANFCTQNTHHKHWIRAKLYTRNEPVYVYRHRAASVSQKKSLYLIFPTFRNRNVLNFRRESCRYGLLNFKVWHLKRWRLTSFENMFSAGAFTGRCNRRYYRKFSKHKKNNIQDTAWLPEARVAPTSMCSVDQSSGNHKCKAKKFKVKNSFELRMFFSRYLT